MARNQKNRAYNDAEEEKEIKRLCDSASDLVKGSVIDTEFGKKLKQERHYPIFDEIEICIGKLLGVGGYGEVLEITSFNLKEKVHHENTKNEENEVNNNYDDDKNKNKETTKAGQKEEEEAVTTHNDDDHDHIHYHIDEARKYMSSNVLRNDKNCRYAIKRLHKDLTKLECARGIIDMSIEVQILSRLWHPNIVKMRGYASCSSFDTKFFIIMDRLYDTLEERIITWKNDLNSNNNSNCCLTSFFSSKSDELKLLENDIQIQRLLIAYDLSSAFAYMHQNMLVYRDIKQDNIGFDVRGNVKVFDFGLSKGLSTSLRARDSANKPMYGYNLTPRTGSIPYMAPEIVNKLPYSVECDVYSFGILLYEMIYLKRAFRGYTKNEYLNRVAINKERPSFMFNRKKCSIQLQSLIKECWDDNPQNRPSMKRIGSLLKGHLTSLTIEQQIRNNDNNDNINAKNSQDIIINRSQYLLNQSQRSMRLHQRRIRKMESTSASFHGGSIHNHRTTTTATSTIERSGRHSRRYNDDDF